MACVSFRTYVIEASEAAYLAAAAACRRRRQPGAESEHEPPERLTADPLCRCEACRAVCRLRQTRCVTRWHRHQLAMADAVPNPAEQARLAAMHEALPIGLALADHAYLAEDPQGGWPRIVTPGMWGARRAKFDERMRRWYAYPPDHPPPAPAQ